MRGYGSDIHKHAEHAQFFTLAIKPKIGETHTPLHLPGCFLSMVVRAAAMPGGIQADELVLRWDAQGATKGLHTEHWLW